MLLQIATASNLPLLRRNIDGTGSKPGKCLSTFWNGIDWDGILATLIQKGLYLVF